MKKGLMISVLAASLLISSTYAKERMGGYMGFADMIEHSEEAEQASSSANNMFMNTEQEKEEYKEQVQEQKEQKVQDGENIGQTGYGFASSAASEYQNQIGESVSSAMQAGSSYKNGAQEQKESQQQKAESESSKNMNQFLDNLDKGKEEIKNQKQEEAKEAKMMKEQLLAMISQEIKDPQVPQDVKNVLSELKKAVKFYKQEELFEDINITQITEQNLEQIQQRVQEAYQKRVQEIKKNLLKEQNKVQLPVSGEFVQYGPGPFDWVYVTTSGLVYNLVGVDSETGTFKYEKLEDVKAVIDEDGVVKFVTDSNDELAELLAQLEAKGYPFVKYNDESENGFDWVIVTKTGKVYKLEGYDEDTGSFVYTPVEGVVAEQEGDEVEFLPGQEA